MNPQLKAKLAEFREARETFGDKKAVNQWATLIDALECACEALEHYLDNAEYPIYIKAEEALERIATLMGVGK